MAVFDGDSPTQWRSKERADQRDRIEGKLVEVGMRAAQLGINVVFDFGLWGKDERSALRWIADSLGVRTQVVYLPIDCGEQRRRMHRSVRDRGHVPGELPGTSGRWQGTLGDQQAAMLVNCSGWVSTPPMTLDALVVMLGFAPPLGLTDGQGEAPGGGQVCAVLLVQSPAGRSARRCAPGRSGRSRRRHWPSLPGSDRPVQLRKSRPCPCARRLYR